MFRKDHQNKTGKSYVSAGSDHTLPKYVLFIIFLLK